MRLARTTAELRADRCILVPTMGALHEGHASLVREAARLAALRGAEVVVSVFVNPTQFNEASDFHRYPRTLDADVEVCRGAGADVVFAPAAEEVYPPGEVVGPPPLPEVARLPGLEDAARPGHFEGVCQVVRRLFELTRPAAALFGEKDWQQLRVIGAMTRALGFPIEIIGMPTVREPDGLAMSSRNRFIPGGERGRALAIPRALAGAAREATPAAAEAVMRAELGSAGLADAVEYAVVRDAATLMAYEPGRPGRALIAARVGPVRLIDNTAWAPAGA